MNNAKAVGEGILAAAGNARRHARNGRGEVAEQLPVRRVAIHAILPGAGKSQKDPLLENLGVVSPIPVGGTIGIVSAGRYAAKFDGDKRWRNKSLKMDEEDEN